MIVLLIDQYLNALSKAMLLYELEKVQLQECLTLVTHTPTPTHPRHTHRKQVLQMFWRPNKINVDMFKFELCIEQILNHFEMILILIFYIWKLYNWDPLYKRILEWLTCWTREWSVCVCGGGGVLGVQGMWVCVGVGVCSTDMTSCLVLNPFKNRFFLVSCTNLNSVLL